MYFIFIVLNKVLDIYTILLLINVLLSWFPNFRNGFTSFVYDVTEPVLFPIRRALYPLLRNFPLDLSVLVAYLLIQLIRQILVRVFMLFI